MINFSNLALGRAEALRGSVGRQDLRFTGALLKPRDEIANLIKFADGTVTDSISQKINHVMAGEALGSKLAKVRQLSMKILDKAVLERVLR